MEGSEAQEASAQLEAAAPPPVPNMLEEAPEELTLMDGEEEAEGDEGNNEGYYGLMLKEKYQTVKSNYISTTGKKVYKRQKILMNYYVNGTQSPKLL